MAQRFWDAAAPLIAVTEEHPFLGEYIIVTQWLTLQFPLMCYEYDLLISHLSPTSNVLPTVSMVDGTLDLEKFRYYVVQDALYLTDFADCFRRVGDKMADVDADVSERLHEFAKGAEEDEKALHRDFFTQWEIDDTNAIATPNTLLYTSYMIRIVSTRCYAEGLAVLLPCMWVYMHVGKCMLKLREELGDNRKVVPQFDAWIDMYGGDEFEKEVKEYIAIVDKVANESDEETLKRMEEHFIMSCKLEHMFWDSAQNLMQWPKIE
jgi:thiaminase/transcriptional activator TenA